MAKKGEKLSDKHKEAIRKAAKRRWVKYRKEQIEKLKKKDPITPKEKKEAIKDKKVCTDLCVVDKPENKHITNQAGRPLSPKLNNIDIEKLPTRFTTSEQLRGYILSQTDGGRQIVDTILADFRSRKSTKQIKRDLAKMLLDMISPDKGSSVEIGMASPDGQFRFYWQNEAPKE